MKNKKFLYVVFSSVLLLGASCSGPLGDQATSAGLAKTTNGGTDWQLANAVVTTTTSGKKTTTKTTSALAGVDAYALVFEPNNSEHVFVATSGGIYFSENSGDTWKQILSKMEVHDLSVDPGNADHIYAAGIVGGNGKVLETKDKGKSWVEVYNEVSNQNTVRSLVLNPNNAKEVAIGLNSGNVIKSQDAGQSWTLMQNFQDVVVQLSWQKSGLYVLTKTKGLFKSTNGAGNFVDLTPLLLDLSSYRKALSISLDAPAIPDVHVPSESVSTFNRFSVSPRNSSLLYIAANNGLFKSTDEGKTWSYLSLPIKSNKTSNIVPIGVVTLGNTDSTVWAAASNTIYKSLNAGSSWQVQAIATNATIQYILIDPRLSQVAFAGLFGAHK